MSNATQWESRSDSYLDTVKRGTNGQENCLEEKNNKLKPVKSRWRVPENRAACHRFRVRALEGILAKRLRFSPHPICTIITASPLPTLCRNWLALVEITRYAIFKHVKLHFKNMIMIKESWFCDALVEITLKISADAHRRVFAGKRRRLQNQHLTSTPSSSTPP